MFALKRPCVNCPFRADTGHLFGLREGRIREIVEAPAFTCHKTLDEDDEDGVPGNHPQQCAGLMALLLNAGRPNQMMQVASRLGALDLDAIEREGVYTSIDEAIAAHKRFSA